METSPSDIRQCIDCNRSSEEQKSNINIEPFD